MSRFREILASHDLQRRILLHCHHDLVRFRLVHFTTVEDFATAKANVLFNNPTLSTTLEVFGPYFHLSRSDRSLQARVTLNQSRGMDPDAPIQAHLRFSRAIASEIPDPSEAPIKLRIEDVRPHVWPSMVTAATDFVTVRDLAAYVEGQFRPTDLFALVGKGRPIISPRAFCVIGRSVGTNNPDLDLGADGYKGVSRRHATIALYSDLEFYLTVLSKYVIVNGFVFQMGEVVRLKQLDVIDIGHFPFIFFEHQTVMAELRATGLGLPSGSPACVRDRDIEEGDDEGEMLDE
jgi:hypothetical protein